MDVPFWLWLVFGGAVLALLACDLAFNHGEGSRARATAWAVVWIGSALAYCALVWIIVGGEAGHEFLAAYAIEQGLGLDNMFVFLVIFQTLGIPPRFQRRVLFWGILGAVVFRAIFIFGGTAVLERWHWVALLFGATLFYAAYRAFRVDPAEKRKSAMLEWLTRRMPVTQNTAGGEFVTREHGALKATPLLLALISIELTDIVFAIDSVPAVLSVSRDPFVVYTSNVFAVLSLRALYLLLARSLRGLEYLHYGIAAVLAFAAFKLVAGDWVPIPPLVSVAIIFSCIGAAVGASLRHERYA